MSTMGVSTMGVSLRSVPRVLHAAAASNERQVEAGSGGREESPNAVCKATCWLSQRRLLC